MTATAISPRRARRSPFGMSAGLLAALCALSFALGQGLVSSSPSSSAATGAFDDAAPSVANLDPGLVDALRRAASDAAADGIDLVVNSGWRSAAEQQRLLDQAIARYGSFEAASRWVATPETSAHVSGDAVDVGPTEGAAWLFAHGARYGLCRTYANEAWHFELHSGAVAAGCPAPFPDPTFDPRMQG